MYEPRTEAQARMACRLYIELYDAGEVGTAVAVATALGDHRSDKDDWQQGSFVVAALFQAKHFDDAGSRGDVHLFALQPDMRQHLAAEVRSGMSLADRLRELLAQAERGEDVSPGTFLRLEHRCRWGS